jgi:hypothetical protein
MIDYFNFLTPILTGMYPSNSFMDGSAIGSFLPILKVPIAALKAVSQRRKLNPSFQQYLKNAHPQCARSCSRVYCSKPLLRASSSALRLSSSCFCFW